jgi:uncharacterized protein (UPF0303 family)
MSDIIAALETQARDLIFPAFDEARAVALGLILLRRAQADHLPVVISIRTTSRSLFHAALPGSTPLNDLWARRKSNTALIFGQSSYLVGLRHAAKGETLARHGLDPADHADHGGAVPIMVAGSGMIAVACVSGLPSAEDHALVIAAFREALDA